ncbi:MAG: hypothetical protein PUP91_04990 [Rhizonema sp. PD37]|nr:hypothetical protein [Rhizonema sp. PD37]
MTGTSASFLVNYFSYGLQETSNSLRLCLSHAQTRKSNAARMRRFVKVGNCRRKEQRCELTSDRTFPYYDR